MSSANLAALSHDIYDSKSQENAFFGSLSPTAMEEFESIQFSASYPAAATLFSENEAVKGIYLVCSGQVKLSVSSSGGKTLTLKIAKPGDILGLSATIANTPYEATAETLHLSRIAFIRRNDLMSFISKHPEVYQIVVRRLNEQYHNACAQLRTMGLSSSAHEKIARLILHWSSSEGKMTQAGKQITVPLTHEQIAECVGSTRETVSRTLRDFKNKHLVLFKGATMIIPNPAALEALSDV
jgi:CRP/FNR family transcriptional regulator, cyclic AMP receptor protein